MQLTYFSYMLHLLDKILSCC